jgi:hypothetical protein
VRFLSFVNSVSGYRVCATVFFRGKRLWEHVADFSLPFLQIIDPDRFFTPIKAGHWQSRRIHSQMYA